MSEFGVRTPAKLAETVRQSENDLEERRREAFLSSYIFHDSHLQTLDSSIEERLRLIELHDQFVEEKRGMNMGERFALALDPRYLNKIHVVELGNTTNPGSQGEIDGLKHEYHDLLGWMKANNIVESELPRGKDSRRLKFREPVNPEALGQVMIVERQRRLVDTQFRHNDQDIDLFIAKRMVFSMPIQSFFALLSSDPSLNEESTIARIENMLHHGSGGLMPIRTAYHLATKVVE